MQPNDLLDVRDERGRLLCQVDAARQVVIVKHKGEPAYEVNLAEARPTARRAVQYQRRYTGRANVKHDD